MYIYKAAVIGAGTMGAEIAQVITYSGLPVVLKDIDDERLKRGVDVIRKIYQRRIEKGKMSREDVQSKMALLTTTTSFDAFKDADIIIEAVPENMELKKTVFKELDEAIQPSAILATNTSALSISELGFTTKRPQKVIGMHFFYPAHVMKLVEVISGLDTADETVSDVIGFCESLRKIPIRVNECAGFLVNRILMPYLNEACFCLQDRIATADEIDRALVEFGFPMGPFTLIDNIGLDICHDVVKILLSSYGNRMKPAPLWEAVYSKKRYGIKSGAGFYIYGEGAGGEDEELYNIINELLMGSASQAKPASMVDGILEFSLMRLLCPMINEAVLCLQEKISSASDIDIAMLAGIGFPQDKQGLLHYADDIGLDKILELLEDFTDTFGDRFWPAPLLRRMVAAGHLGKKTGKGFFEYT